MAECNQEKCLVDQMLAGVFGLESGVTPVGCCSFFFIMMAYMV